MAEWLSLSTFWSIWKIIFRNALVKPVIKFAPEVKQALVLGKEVADKYNCLHLDDLLLLIGLIKSSAKIESYLANHFSVTAEYLEDFIDKQHETRGFSTITLTLVAESALKRSIIEQRLTTTCTISSMHVVLSLARHTTSKSYLIFSEKGFDYQKCVEAFYTISSMDEKAFKNVWSQRVNNQFIYKNVPPSLLSFLIRYV